jgi:alpha-glucosidase
MVRGWLNRGVDGLRLDVFNVFLKDPELRSNPVRPGGTGWDSELHVNDRDAPDLPDLLERFRAMVDAEPGRMTVGELFDGPTERAVELTSGHHLVFDWGLLESSWTEPALRAAIERREAVFGPDRWPTLAFSNHDRSRHAGRLAATAGISDTDAVARAAAVLLFGLRGTPFLYYGEEIGALDVEVPPEESVDPPAKTRPGWWDRSPCRTPMAWSGAPDAGFGSSRPWLRFAADVAQRNVADQSRDPNSVLACYRRLIAARRDSPALSGGSFKWLAVDTHGVLAWRRIAGSNEAVVVLNVEDHPVELDVDFGRPFRGVVGTHLGRPDLPNQRGRVHLAPLEGIVGFLEPG